MMGNDSKWMFVFAAVLFALGCVGEPVDPADVSATALRAGEFELRAGQARFLGDNQRISCELGRTFGVDYRLEVPPGSAGTVPVRFRWIHPRLEIPRLGISGTESPGGNAQPELPRGAESLEGRGLWMITHPEERIPGAYTFQIETIDGSRTLLTRSFEVVGC